MQSKRSDGNQKQVRGLRSGQDPPPSPSSEALSSSVPASASAARLCLPGHQTEQAPEAFICPASCPQESPGVSVAFMGDVIASTHLCLLSARGWAGHSVRMISLVPFRTMLMRTLSGRLLRMGDQGSEKPSHLPGVTQQRGKRLGWTSGQSWVQDSCRSGLLLRSQLPQRSGALAAGAGPLLSTATASASPPAAVRACAPRERSLGERLPGHPQTWLVPSLRGRQAALPGTREDLGRVALQLQGCRT